MDLRLALQLLAEHRGLATIRTDSGGALNGALLAAGLVDRITVIIAPRIGRDPDAQTLIRLPAALAAPCPLQLAESEVLDDGAVWLVYDVRHPS